MITRTNLAIYLKLKGPLIKGSFIFVFAEYLAPLMRLFSLERRNNMKKYFKMKYEQFLMRLFDLVMNLISKSGVNWYPQHVFKEEGYCDDADVTVVALESENEKLWERFMESERECDSAVFWAMQERDRADHYFDALCKYEPWRLE